MLLYRQIDRKVIGLSSRGPSDWLWPVVLSWLSRPDNSSGLPKDSEYLPFGLLGVRELDFVPRRNVFPCICALSIVTYPTPFMSSEVRGEFSNNEGNWSPTVWSTLIDQVSLGLSRRHFSFNGERHDDWPALNCHILQLPEKFRSLLLVWPQ